jgi:hypothetical protein
MASPSSQSLQSNSVRKRVYAVIVGSKRVVPGKHFGVPVTAIVRAVDARNESFRCKNLLFLFDTGANAHVCNNKELFVGGVRVCNVLIYGIGESSGDRVPLRATVCGDIVYDISESESVVLKDVLYVPDAVLGDSVSNDESSNTVLVSGHKFVSECGLGLSFPVGGDRVEFIDREGSVRSHFKSNVLGLFVDGVTSPLVIPATTTVSTAVVTPTTTTTTTTEKEKETREVERERLRVGKKEKERVRKREKEREKKREQRDKIETK